jgi:hypothetical protein
VQPAVSLPYSKQWPSATPISALAHIKTKNLEHDSVYL